jgi:Ca2+-binding EF-hand superfamily protein
MSGVGSVGYAAFSPAIQQYQQNLFNQIDANGDGVVSQTELEQAVTQAGGSGQSADALYSLINPGSSAGFDVQQFSQVLPGPVLSDQVQSQMIGYQAQGWPGAQATGGGGLAQDLFNQIDSNGDGAISQSELEQAVTQAGGTTAAADALYAKLDPNGTGSVSEQQFAQSLQQSMPHHHHHHGGRPPDATDANSSSDGGAGDALTALFDADNGGADNTPLQIAQNIFSQIDSNGDGAITQSELEQAVTAAGGSTSGADALYAKLDPNNTGSVSAQQFIDTLQPPSPTGTTAQDALLALIGESNQTGAVAPTGSSNSSNMSTIVGNALDALTALLQSFDPATSNGTGNGNAGNGNGNTGNSAQDAIAALLKGTDASSNGSGASAVALNSTDLARAFALYQSQIEQQVLNSLNVTQSAVI